MQHVTRACPAGLNQHTERPRQIRCNGSLSSTPDPSTSLRMTVWRPPCYATDGHAERVEAWGVIGSLASTRGARGSNSERQRSGFYFSYIQFFLRSRRVEPASGSFSDFSLASCSEPLQ